MRRGVGPTISDFRQYVLARAHGFEDIADVKERFVIENLETFCRIELAELSRRCCLTGANVGNTVARLAEAWKSRPQPVAFIPPTLNETPQALLMQGWEPLSGKTLKAP